MNRKILSSCALVQLGKIREQDQNSIEAQFLAAKIALSE